MAYTWTSFLPSDTTVPTPPPLPDRPVPLPSLWTHSDMLYEVST